MPFHRGITSELYGGGADLRLTQEMVLGIGGWRLLQHLGIRADVCHLNEGHAAFAVLERAACFMDQTRKSFEVALTATRSGNLFTTHTPVAAGFDRFDPALARRYLGPFVARRMPGVSLENVLALGRRDPGDPNEPFNMAYLAVRGSGAINGVSRLHGSVSRAIFADLFPRWPEADVPVGYVTNGVHTPTWDSVYAQRLWWTAYGKNPWASTMEGVSEKIAAMPDNLIWGLCGSSRKELIEYLRERLVRQYAAAGESDETVDRARTLFDPNVLTLGFARRFATYKRPTLLLHDPERLARILTNPSLPVQLVIAGKAHPADEPGKAMIRQWIQFVKRPDVQGRVAFVADYDMMVAQRLVQGVDVWINTPRRPWEASGTSGMKVLVNGGLNLSELDGWWAEAYTPEVGWAVGDGKEHNEDPGWDAAEAVQLYEILEREVIPKFYRRDESGMPREWIAMMRESMARLTPQFSANRTVREYTEKYYLPGAAAYRKREASAGSLGKEIVKWRDAVAANWHKLNFGPVHVETRGDLHEFRAQVYLGELSPDFVQIELYAEARNGEPSLRQPMVKSDALVGIVGGYAYTGQVPSNRPASDYTPRMTPMHPDVSAPLEASQILWQH